MVSEDLLWIEELVEPPALETGNPDEEQREHEDQRKVGFEDTPAEQQDRGQGQEEGNAVGNEAEEARDFGGQQDEETDPEQRIDVEALGNGRLEAPAGDEEEDGRGQEDRRAHRERKLRLRRGLVAIQVALSLNASFQFLGFSTGAALGSLTMANASPLALGWVGASCVLGALALVLATSRHVRSPSPIAA